MAASGGVCTELLIAMLDDGVVDNIITTQVYENDHALKPIVVSKDDNYKEILRKCCGSNYCPVENSSLIELIKKARGTSAVVALPCTQYGLHIWKSRFDKEGKLKYIIGLLCNHVPSYNATDYMCEEYGRKDADKVSYRGYGWFGAVSFYKKSTGSALPAHMELVGQVPFGQYYSGNIAHMFWQDACINCKDHFGMYADVAFGDADFIKVRDQANIGESAIFVKNREITVLLERLRDKGIIDLNTIASDNDLAFFNSIGENRHRWFLSSTDQWARYDSNLGSDIIWNHDDNLNIDIKGTVKENQIKSEYMLQVMREVGVSDPATAEVVTWGFGGLLRDNFDNLNRRFSVRLVCDSNKNWQGHTFYPGFKVISPQYIHDIKERLGCLQRETFVVIAVKSKEALAEIERNLAIEGIKSIHINDIL